VAVRADNGKMLWEASVAQPKGVTEIERIADITSLPVVDGRLVYAVAYQGRIAAVDRVSGRVVWNRDISSLTGLNAEDTRIFVSHAIGSVYALDYTNGKTYWRQAALKNRQLTAPMPMGSMVAVGDLEGYVHFLSREDGAVTSRIKTGSDAVMPQLALVNSNTVLAQTRDGGIYAIQIK
jgi:outer membrane protein assembly factor BamB